MKARTVFTGALLVGCVVLLQYHSVQFWRANVDAWTGAGWSVLLEGAALWLWSHPRLSRRMLGALATLLLLAGPLYQVSAPLVQEWQQGAHSSSAHQQRHAQISAELATMEASLAAYQANSMTRQGWTARIDAAQARIIQLRDEQAKLTRESGHAAPRMTWQGMSIIGLQAIAIVLFQLIAVLTISELRAVADKGAATKPTASPNRRHIRNARNNRNFANATAFNHAAPAVA